MEVVLSARARRLRTSDGGNRLHYGLTVLSGLCDGPLYLLPIKWVGPICPFVSEATARISASVLLFFILYNANMLKKKAFNLEIRLKKKLTEFTFALCLSFNYSANLSHLKLSFIRKVLFK